MKILFDLSGRIQCSSITVYAKRVLEGLQEDHHQDVIVICSNEIYDDVKRCYPKFQYIQFKRDRKRHNFLLNCARWKKAVKNLDYDIVLSPHPLPGFCLFEKRPVVTVFHDIHGIRVFKGRTLWRFRLFYLTWLFKSSKIITITNYVKDDIIRSYPFIRKNKLKTIYNGLLFNKCEVVPMKGNYLLYVSTLLKHKNIITLLKAFNSIKQEITQNVVIIGKTTPYWEETILPYIEENGLKNRVIHIPHRISDEELSQYYSNTDLFVHPSLYEGFGYTPIEAAIHKVPVLSNKETALHETTMGLLNYYEPATNENAMAEQIKFLLQNPPTKAHLEEISQMFQQQYNNKMQVEKVYKFLKDIYLQRL